MLCYLMGMEPYYIQCIKDGPFKPKIVDGLSDKPESQWTQDERRVVNQDPRLKSIIISCLPDDIIESVISCEIAKPTWTDLVHNVEGPFDTKKNKIMDLKLEYQTFRAKPFESLSQTYTHYKTLLNELDNYGVTLSKHEIHIGFVNSLPKKWLSFSQGLRNANLSQTLDIDGIYGRFVYEDNLIARRFPETKKALITTPSNSPISTAFFSNNIVQDFQENSNDEADERYSEEYLRDLDLESPMSNSSMSKGFQPKFIPKLIQSSQHAQSSQSEPKVQKDYKSEYKKMKAKLAFLEASPSTSQAPKTFQSKNKGLVAETFDWDEEAVLDEEEETRVQVLMALVDDELSVGKNHAHNGEWIDITMKKQIPIQKKKILGGEQLSEKSLVFEVKENSFIPTSLDYDHEVVPKSKDWVERVNHDNKLPNFNTGRILVPKSQTVNESLQHNEALTNTESSKDSVSEPQTPLPLLKTLQGASLRK
ncbi:hypothetical protein Tco_0409233 [Tanacetum coccineum]